jgi:acyl-coenzyme A synthetase/AMP-(fatty) acid ligase
MHIVVVDDSKEKRVHKISKRMKDDALCNKVLKIHSKSKEESALKIAQAYLSEAKPILYDLLNSSVEKLFDTLDVASFEKESFSVMLFTSGTTGAPVGVMKTKNNIEADVDALVKKFSQFEPKAFVTTVPFIHVYGFLVGLMLPMRLGVDVIVKEHFLPHDLLAFAKTKRIIVTTPLYIKALLRLNEEKELKNTLFVSSAGPLAPKIAKDFVDKYKTNLVQIFGSTETGSVAYRTGDEAWWQPFDGVNVSVSKEGILHVNSAFIADKIWKGSLVKTGNKINTFDYAQLRGDKFQVLGRSQQILKIAGKRFSTIAVEETLEKMPHIKSVLVKIERDENALKDESLIVYVVLNSPLSTKEIINRVRAFLKNKTISIKVALVEKIPTSATGKKIVPIL